MKLKQQKGFTLIESVISVLLLAVMSMMAYQATDVVLSANERSRTDLTEEIRLHRAWQIIASDLIHLRPRAYSDGLGVIEAAFETGRAGALVSFTRGHDAILESNPTGITRIRYGLNENNEFIRDSQPAFLSFRDYQSIPQVLLKGVEAVTFEQLSNDRTFVPQWPPLNSTLTNSNLPGMIRVSITLEDGSTTWRIFPGVGFSA
jgi:type II secretion system protein J